MKIKEATSTDLDAVLTVERLAFGNDKEATLVRNLLADPSAAPVLSLLAVEAERAVGHILFTAGRLDTASETVGIALLAPLAVVPEYQRIGVGGALVQRGLEMLRAAGTGVVFVLGHPEYYPRHGFSPAGRLGFEAPYPIPEAVAGAWMVQALRPELLGVLSGRFVCADALMRPEYWRE